MTSSWLYVAAKPPICDSPTLEASGTQVKSVAHAELKRMEQWFPALADSILIADRHVKGSLHSE